ncbi:MAG TPA: MBL fold metallo-hydrolase [Polyangiaceae bacterium]|jgi:flavorubredoxin|nr:MBL fold metallo-hydrolase [Polyangiaceae bacterium]
MTTTNTATGTRIDEIAQGIYRISTPIPANPALPAGFTFNQFLVLDDEPLLFHTGPRKLFSFVKEAVATVLPVAELRWISFGHFEADECGSLDEWLDSAPNALPACGQIGAMVNVNDYARRPARVLSEGEIIDTGHKRFRWLDTPHVPHGWDAGILFEATTKTLFCGDLFTQPGAEHEPVTESDVVGPSEGMRRAMDYYANPKLAAAQIERVATTEPALLACMHGAAYRGDGAAALRALAAAVGA